MHMYLFRIMWRKYSVRFNMKDPLIWKKHSPSLDHCIVEFFRWETKSLLILFRSAGRDTPSAPKLAVIAWAVASVSQLLSQHPPLLIHTALSPPVLTGHQLTCHSPGCWRTESCHLFPALRTQWPLRKKEIYRLSEGHEQTGRVGGWTPRVVKDKKEKHNRISGKRFRVQQHQSYGWWISIAWYCNGGCLSRGQPRSVSYFQNMSIWYVCAFFENTKTCVYSH